MTGELLKNGYWISCALHWFFIVEKVLTMEKKKKSYLGTVQ